MVEGVGHSGIDVDHHAVDIVVRLGEGGVVEVAAEAVGRGQPADELNLYFFNMSVGKLAEEPLRIVRQSRLQTIERGGDKCAVRNLVGFKIGERGAALIGNPDLKAVAAGKLPRPLVERGVGAGAVRKIQVFLKRLR